MAKIDPSKLKKQLSKTAPKKANLRDNIRANLSTSSKPKGKGMNAVLSSDPKTRAQELAKDFLYIPLNKIIPNRNQPRKNFDQEALEGLAESIKIYGVIQPITVRANDDFNSFLLISGERRFKAATMAGLKEIPAYLRTPNDQELAEMALVENLFREDLNPLEIAMTYERLIEEFKLTQEQLAKRIEKGRTTVTNYIRLLKLEEIAKKSLLDGQISMGHAKALLGIDDKALQKQVVDEILDQHLSVRATEARVRLYNDTTYQALSVAGKKALAGGKIKLEHGKELLALSDPQFQEFFIKMVIKQDLLASELKDSIHFYKSPSFASLATFSKDKFIAAEINLEQAEALTEIEDSNKQKKACETILLHHPTGEVLEQLIAKFTKVKKASQAAALPHEYEIVQEAVRKNLGLFTSISLQDSKKGKGKITLSFDNVDQLNDLLDRLDISVDGD